MKVLVWSWIMKSCSWPWSRIFGLGLGLSLKEKVLQFFRTDLMIEWTKKKKKTLYYQMTFVFVFRPKMNVHFRFRFVFGRKWNFVFVGIFFYGRIWKMFFGRRLVYITKRSWSWSWSWDTKSWSWSWKNFKVLVLKLRFWSWSWKKVLIISLVSVHLIAFLIKHQYLIYSLFILDNGSEKALKKKWWFLEPDNEINCMDFNQEGDQFATAGSDHSIRIYDTETLKVFHFELTAK